MFLGYRALKILSPLLRFLPYPRSVVVKYGNLTFLVPLRSLDVYLRNFEHVLIDKAYTKLSSFEPRKHDKVLDAGASIGFYTVLAASRGSTVVALEPYPPHCRYLAMNIHINKLRDKVKILRAALSTKLGTVTLFVGINELTSSIIPEHPRFLGGVKSCIEVKGIDLETLHHVLGPFTLIKLDVECLELEIIRSGRRALKDVERIVVEVHLDCIDITKVVEELTSLGFTTVTTLDSEEPYQAIVYAFHR